MKNYHQNALSILITLIGLIFIVSAIKFDAFSIVFTLGVVLSVSPFLYKIIFPKENEDDKRITLLLLLLPISVIVYVFALKFGLPSGFSDVHFHISVTENLLSNGSINFSEQITISSNFVGLYLLYNKLALITGLSIPTLATYVHPFFSLIIIVFLYLFFRKMAGQKIALMATFIFGWEITFLQFGEFRTQSLAIVAVVGCLFLFTLWKKGKLHNNPAIMALIILLYASLVITSFVGYFHLLVFLFIVAIFNHLPKPFKETGIYVPTTLIYLVVVLFFAYLFYIGESFDNIVLSIAKLIQYAFLGEPFSQVDKMQGLVGSTYGDFTLVLTWIFRGIFIVATLLCFKLALTQKKEGAILTLIAAAFILGSITILTSSFALTLNPSRTYYFFMIPASIIIAYGFINIMELMKSKIITKQLFMVSVLIFLVLFSSTSITKLPAYIIGSTWPFRGYEKVDSIRYYDIGRQDISASTFLGGNATDITTYFSMIIKPYMYSEPYIHVGKSSEELIKDDLSFNSEIIYGLVVLRDSYEGESYWGRERFPRLEDYDRYDRIFTNGGIYIFRISYQ